MRGLLAVTKGMCLSCVHEQSGKGGRDSHCREMGQPWPWCLCNYYKLWGCQSFKYIFPSIFFPLHFNIQVLFRENIFPHGPNSLPFDLSKQHPIRFILCPENYLSFLYEAGISPSYKQVLSITGFACLSALHLFAWLEFKSKLNTFACKLQTLSR